MCGDAEWPAVFEDRTIKARGTHSCCECGSEISPGEEYQRCKGLWDGEWSTFKTCSVCEEIRKEAEETLDYKICFGELYDCIGMDL
jgi:predicted metal-dependent phosphoesterase TrpH